LLVAGLRDQGSESSRKPQTNTLPLEAFQIENLTNAFGRMIFIRYKQQKVQLINCLIVTATFDCQSTLTGKGSHEHASLSAGNLERLSASLKQSLDKIRFG
jgi:hypothetical protein